MWRKITRILDIGIVITVSMYPRDKDTFLDIGAKRVQKVLNMVHSVGIKVELLISV